MSTNLLDRKQVFEGTATDSILEALKTAEQNKNYYAFYDRIKASNLPFIPCNEKDTKVVHEQCFDLLRRLGEVSIPVSVALSMHYYILAAVASYPFSKTSKEYWKRELLLKKIKKERLLIANTGSIRTFKSVEGNQSIVADKIGDNYLISGKAPFMSLSGIADYAVFTAEMKDGDKAVFFIALDQEGIVFKDTAFGDAMEGSFTRSVEFRNVKVNGSGVIRLEANEDQRSELLIYQRSWFQALIPAPYLGAAQAVMNSLKVFGNKKIKKGKLLAESDSFLDALGELQIRYQAASQLSNEAANALADFKTDDKKKLKRIFESSVVAKYFSTHFAEEIVSKARHLMGTRFLTPGSLTEKVYKEIVFGPLQPMTDTDIMEYFGDLAIGREKS
ncbi:MAG: acyl-CoA dehydrogenase family protein [Bacteroidota bacterium]